MKRLISLLLSVCTVFSLVFALFSCGAPTKKEYYIPDLFDTDTYVYDYSGLESREFLALGSKIKSELERYHNLYDKRNEYDGIVNLCSLNRMAGQGPVTVAPEIIDLLSFAKEIYSKTGGHTNVAMGSVISLWHDCAYENGVLPSDDALSLAAAHTNIEDIKIDRESLSVEILDPELSIDVGAVAKGYAVEQIAIMLENEGYSGIVIDAGGNLRAVGAKPDGEGWETAVRNPNLSSGDFPYRLTIKDEAFVTSGGYRRYYLVNGEKYHHIINKDTLYPINTYLSVSVKSPSSAYSDAYSTAIFNMSYTEICSFVEENPELFVVLIMADGEVRTVGNE